MARTELVFEGLPTFESTPLFFGLEDDVDARLRTLAGTYARCNAALRFNSWVGASADTLRVHDDELASMHVACLRAALMEFAGMEEALGTDLPNSSAPLRIRDTRNAMLVVLRELRNVQIHLVRGLLLAERRPAILRWGDEAHEHDFIALMIPPEDLAKLRDSRNGAHYLRSDFDRAVNWLAEAQQHWGIHDVVREGIWAYAKAIVTTHLPAAA